MIIHRHLESEQVLMAKQYGLISVLLPGALMLGWLSSNKLLKPVPVES